MPHVRQPTRPNQYRGLAGLLALILLAFAFPALADPIGDCNDAADPSIRVDGCNAIIDGNPPLDVLAIAHMNRAIGYAAEGDLEKALVDLDAALEADPELVAALYNRGNVLLELGRTERAIADFGAVIRYMPDFALAWLNRGLAREHDGDKAGAAADYVKALELDRKLTAARRGLERVKPRT